MAPLLDEYTILYRLAAGDNAAAYDYLLGWNRYCHAIDDLIDAPEKDAQKLLDTLALANILFSCDFYQAHSQAFRLAVLIVTNAYADSLNWAGSPHPWQVQWADTLRFAGNEMVLSVAAACGGYERMREVSLRLRESSWNQHHVNNQPT